MAGLKQRNGKFYLTYYIGSGKQKRVALDTDSYQVALAKKREFELTQSRGLDPSLPTRTPIADVLTQYVEHVRATAKPKSGQTVLYYLRDMFGPVCDALKITSRKVGPASRKRKLREGQDRRRRAPVIEASSFEAITTASISAFISGQVQSRGLAPKTANRYREIASALFNWAMTQRGIRMPGNANPAAAVQRYKEPAPEIRFLTLPQIDEQLQALEDDSRMQAMVAVLIYAGLRREELVWLRLDDIDRDGAAHGLIRVRAKTVKGEHWEPKTKANRVVPISAALRSFLDRYHPPPSRGDWFFPSPAGLRWDPDNFSADLRAANRAAGLVWGCLDFRHTFGSQLAMRGVSLYKISKLMGNSPEICRRHYAALIPEDLGDAVEFPSPRTPAGPPPALRVVRAQGA